MLKSLHIKGLAVVQELQLDFQPGMTVLTGETGAGKSILLTAMGLCLGDRADSSYVRPGNTRAEVSLEFSVEDAPPAMAWLVEQELDDEDGCLIRRTIHADGRSRAYVNGQPTTLQRLQELAEHLVNIHGQHDHLLLLRGDRQRQIVDESLPDQQSLHQCAEAFNRIHSLKQEWAELTGGSDQTQQKELLRYQINELEQAGIEQLRYDELVDQHAQLANMEQILSIGQNELNRLYEHDDQSIHQQLGEAAHEIERLSGLSSDFEPVATQLRDILVLLQDSSRELRHTLDQKEMDPAELSLLDEQLDQIHTLARKLQVAPQALPDTLLSLRQKLDTLEQQDQRLEVLQSEIKSAEQDFQNHSLALSCARSAVADEMSRHITEQLTDLGMPDGQFAIEVIHQADATPSSHGQDTIQFSVSTNPGLPLKPVARVASGGELSRICLAIQVTINRQTTAPTLIFDEVDSGIGGGVAETVGRQLRQIGQLQQVFCVTHLPQVAAQAHHHLLVSKTRSDDSTQSQVVYLEPAERQQEVARMLGGRSISETTLAHAEEMLQSAAND